MGDGFAMQGIYSEMTEPEEPRFCQAIVVQGRLYLSNGDPGYPDEYCDNEAEEDSEYCSDHRGYEDEPDYGYDSDIEPDPVRGPEDLG